MIGIIYLYYTQFGQNLWIPSLSGACDTQDILDWDVHFCYTLCKDTLPTKYVTLRRMHQISLEEVDPAYISPINVWNSVKYWNCFKIYIVFNPPYKSWYLHNWKSRLKI